MGFSIIYKRLVELKILHGFYLHSYDTTNGEEEFFTLSQTEQDSRLKDYDVRDNLHLFPTERTQKIMRGLGLIFKLTSTGFFVACKAREVSPNVYTPERSIPDDVKLSFVVRTKTGDFPNITNLNLSSSGRKIYYFDNLNSPAGNTQKYLTKTPPSFDASFSYMTGDIIQEGNTLFEASQDGLLPNPTIDSTGWKELAGTGYVNVSDQISLYPPVFNLDFSGQPLLAAQVDFLDANGNTFSAGSATGSLSQPLGGFQVDLIRNLTPEGRYKMVVTGTDTTNTPFNYEEEVYIDNALARSDVFGIVEVLNKPGNSLGELEFLDSNNGNTLLTPVYTIHFKNRSSFWRYHFKTNPGGGVDLGDLRLVNGEYISQDYLPTIQRYVALTYDSGTLLPNPGSFLVKPENQSVFSDIYIYN